MKGSDPDHPALSSVITADGSATLYSACYAQTFASRRGALTESRQVFLENSGVAARFGARLGAGTDTVRVLEVGFGTGLNFFVTAQACLQTPGARLDYTALEQTLLDAATVGGLGYAAQVGEIAEAYVSWRDGVQATDGAQVFEHKSDHAAVRLELLLGEATTQTLPTGTFHAVYHDAFSPEVNPELWTEAFLAHLTAALLPGGTLVSYCVQGAVRRRLQGLGLEVGKRPGPAGGKREVLVAHRPARNPGS